jgi:UDP-N-acetylglucosamine 2-epimerase (non-hydrolysing)
MSQVRPLLLFGTRPEAIKMAPVVRECWRRSDELDPVVCQTGQHREMLLQVTDYFGISVHIDLALMRPNQPLAELTARCLQGVDEVIERVTPDCVVAQGDTTTVLCAAMAAFYRRIPFVHVEAGLRTGNLMAPWPEEFNRRVASLTTALHCAPTTKAAQALLSEGVAPDRVRVTGNTVIDALLWTIERERANDKRWRDKYAMLGRRRVVLITGHRRENFGGGFESITRAVAELAARFSETEFVYPVHLNPNVQEAVHRLLGGRPNIHLVPPSTYPEFVWLMDRATLILTDSGGVQEEAPSFGKPVLVMRQATERPESIDAGVAELVGTDYATIVARVSSLLTDPEQHAKRPVPANPYGDGSAAKRIVDWVLERPWENLSIAR